MKIYHTYLLRSGSAQSGFTLVELIIVVVIIGILLSIGTINFNQWQVKSNINKETRELYTELNRARLNAIHTKKRHSVVLNTSNYILKNYSSENEDTLAGTVLETKAVKYQLSTPAASLSNEHYEFDVRGFLSNTLGDTVVVNPIYSGSAVDCIVISVGRVNMGKMSNATTCTF
jgi:prepilin-type N-terminal cleavage/methylation domain-containing protein